MHVVTLVRGSVANYVSAIASLFIAIFVILSLMRMRKIKVATYNTSH